MIQLSSRMRTIADRLLGPVALVTTAAALLAAATVVTALLNRPDSSHVGEVEPLVYLQHVLNQLPSDLEANRSGYIAWRQLLKLQDVFIAVLSVLALFVSAVWIAGIFGEKAHTWKETAFFYVFALLMGAIGAFNIHWVTTSFVLHQACMVEGEPTDVHALLGKGDAQIGALFHVGRVNLYLATHTYERTEAALQTVGDSRFYYDCSERFGDHILRAVEQRP